MKIGVSAMLTQSSLPVTTLACALEELGFESLWLPEHSHIPTTSVFPAGAGPVPREYGHTLDPFVALAAAASVTRTLKVGTGICLLAQRDTIQTAKAVASLDVLSGGRVVFGVGGGWNQAEMHNHGASYASRFKKLEEQIEALRLIWTQDEAEYHGAYVEFDRMWCWPKPAACPPICIGGESEHTLRRVVRCADGWLPRVRDPNAILDGIRKLRELSLDAGRDPATLSISVFGVQPSARSLARFREAGVDRAVLSAPRSGSHEDFMKSIEGFAEVVKA